jgi:hypothetical protein
LNENSSSSESDEESSSKSSDYNVISKRPIQYALKRKTMRKVLTKDIESSSNSNIAKDYILERREL